MPGETLLSPEVTRTTHLPSLARLVITGLPCVKPMSGSQVLHSVLSLQTSHRTVGDAGLVTSSA